MDDNIYVSLSGSNNYAPAGTGKMTVSASAQVSSFVLEDDSTFGGSFTIFAVALYRGRTDASKVKSVQMSIASVNRPGAYTLTSAAIDTFSFSEYSFESFATKQIQSNNTGRTVSFK